eukprot:snap_masked-scaffold_1-processed-gene-1.25-mRNA-1 protein AED:1.00 eAED:1.00 QI:0/-1/0/0/-1/1/1/0/69
MELGVRRILPAMTLKLDEKFLGDESESLSYSEFQESGIEEIRQYQLQLESDIQINHNTLPDDEATKGHR